MRSVLAVAAVLALSALPAMAATECVGTPFGPICFDVPTNGGNTVTQSNSASQSSECSDPDCTSSSTVTQSNN